jgi:hypothetical protein
VRNGRVWARKPVAESDPYADFDIQNETLVRYTGNGGSVVIPPGITSVGDNAFHGCSSLKTIELSRHTRIDGNAFDDVSGSLRYRD